MKRWILGISFVVVIAVGVAWLYQAGGLKEYLGATIYLNKLTGTEKTMASEQLYGTGEGNFYNGILAGVWVGHVWVWGKTGLRIFTVDQYSVYSYTDGCSGLVLNSNKPIDVFVMGRQLYFDLDSWRVKVKTGDFVNVLVATKENGGTVGNMREIHTYNWWSWMGKDMQTECAK